MTIKKLVETVLKPFCSDKVQIVYEGKIEYLDYPKDNQVYTWLMEKQVREIYTTKDGDIGIVAI